MTSQINQLRRENLRRVIDQRGGATKVSQQLGYRSASFLSQLVGPKPTREVTEKSARRFESDLGLEQGSLDRPADAPQAAPATQGAPFNVSMVAETLRMLGAVLAAENANLPPQKFADVAALAVEDAGSHGGQPREGHIKALVRLVK